MDYPLTLQHFLERARRLFGRKEIVSRMSTGLHRYTYADLDARVRSLAKALHGLGVRKGDRVATLAWNDHRHLEMYFAVPCIGAVLHTVNLRLSPDQLVYMIEHAGDRILVVDPGLLPTVEAIRDRIPSVERFIVLSEDARGPHATLSPSSSYESLLAGASGSFALPTLDESDAAVLCYTSGTTGDPKGVLYSHRALFLHSMAEGLADTFAVSEHDTVMPVVPMFHVNGWGLPYTSTMVGAKQILPGAGWTPRDLVTLIETENVTLAAAVPTVWIALHQFLQTEPHDLRSLRALIAGGAAVPRTLIETFEREHGIHVTQAWGMTETTPLGSVSNLTESLSGAPEELRLGARAKAGVPSPGVDARIVDATGKDLPWDGVAMGELWVRGPWIASAYFCSPATEAFTSDGWFRTGDMATLDPDGYIAISDRLKDLVKSGGEWISSVALENLLMAHPKVREAAVMAGPHEKWIERPLACVVPDPGATVPPTKDELLEFLRPKVPKFWLPDDIVFLRELPKTSVGKLDKRTLRRQFGGTVSGVQDPHV